MSKTPNPAADMCINEWGNVRQYGALVAIGSVKAPLYINAVHLPFYSL